jgi:LPS-assembly protein
MKDGREVRSAHRERGHCREAGVLRAACAALALLALVLHAPPGFGGEIPKKIPVTVTADNLQYDRTNDTYTASGHVRVEHQGMRVEADKLVLNNRTGMALAEGNVYLLDKGDVIMADRIEVNLNTRAGLILNGNIFMGKDNYHLRGARIERLSESAYHIVDGVFTTCDASEWYFKARELDVDLDRYASGSDVSFHMAGMPVLYSPYLLLPVRRQTGLLIPEIGFGSTDGFLMKNAFFWAISDSKDATVISDYRAKTGLGTGVEYRYVNSRDSAGRAWYNYFDTFHSSRTRWEAQFQHREEIAEDLSFRADIAQVSDWSYYRDLEKKLELRARPYIDSNAFYVERWNTASLYLLGQYSTDLTGPNDRTLQKLPELRYVIYGEPLGSRFYARFNGSATNFTSQSSKSVLRADFQPELDAAFGNRGVSLTPRVGGRATFYDQSASSTQPSERKYLYAGADLNARLSRVYGEDVPNGIGRVRHSIEPTISYFYIPKIDQGDIPHLDSVDQVKEANTITLSLINRLTARYQEAGTARSFDIMVFRLSESYDVNEARRQDVASKYPRSPLKGELYLRTPKRLSGSATVNYDTYIKRVTDTSQTIALNTEPVQLDLTHQYLREPRTRFLITGLGFKVDKWTVRGQLWRDVETKTFTQQEYKVHYASQCWGLGLEFITKPGERNYYFVFDLKGLGTMKF